MRSVVPPPCSQPPSQRTPTRRPPRRGHRPSLRRRRSRARRHPRARRSPRRHPLLRPRPKPSPLRGVRRGLAPNPLRSPRPSTVRVPWCPRHRPSGCSDSVASVGSPVRARGPSVLPIKRLPAGCAWLRPRSRLRGVDARRPKRQPPRQPPVRHAPLAGSRPLLKARRHRLTPPRSRETPPCPCPASRT